MRCGLLGRTLSLSHSPLLHSLLGSYDYALFEIPPEQVEDFLRSGPWDGLNVTILYKRTAYALCDSLSPAAREAGNHEEKTMSSIGYHEPVEELSAETRDMHRAIVSLMEELEAVDWYNQRAEVCTNSELKAILQHNRDEEKEHASMLLEWIRRQDAKFSDEIKDYLLTDKPIADA